MTGSKGSASSCAATGAAKSRASSGNVGRIYIGIAKKVCVSRFLLTWLPGQLLHKRAFFVLHQLFQGMLHRRNTVKISHPANTGTKLSGGLWSS